MIIDGKGRLFSKVSVIDIIVLTVIIGLGVSWGYKAFSGNTQQIISPNTRFYTTFLVEKVRDYSVNAVQEGDVFFEQHDSQPMGKVVKVTTETAYDVMKRTDGTAQYVPMEDRYNLFITLECTGSINDSGYFVNGNKNLAEGSDMKINSNMILCSGRVFLLSENLD